MKRSVAVKLLLVPLVVLAACGPSGQGCNETTTESAEIKHCIDDDGGVVEERLCDVDAGQPENATDASTTTTESTDAGSCNESAPSPHRTTYHWYYGGTRTVWSPGTRVSGGSYTPTVGKTYVGPSTISRGGFGGIGRGSPGVGS